MSIWASVALGAKASDMNDPRVSPHAASGPNDHTVDIAMGGEQVRLCIWPDRDPSSHYGKGINVAMLIDRDSAEKIRDALTKAISFIDESRS